MAPEEKAFFLQPASWLPNESVLWRGKPSSKATKVMLIELLMCIAVMVSLLISGIYCVSLLERRESRKPAPHVAAESPSPSESPASSSTGTTTQPPRRSEHIPMFVPLLPILFAGLIVSLIVSVAFSVALIRTITSAYIVTTERILLFSGWLNKSALTLDLDKVISVKVSSSWLERLFRLYTIELTHAGNNMMSARNPWLVYNPYTLVGIPLDEPLHDKISNHWLPRDNGATGRKV